ncbi:Catechol O-methyltransferase A [Hyphodiscus hymeniophilus]|uniref:catechol O-methyltransferase n=1 Tax=Hyphodiscus hymeniophilus TaxID=353542 RepID=A0A9P6VDR4_9HELO|nr:Catechol O-methyltransferase A [Hyphodiscus hymeniophilus]
MTAFDPSKWPSMAKAIESEIESHDGREQKLLTSITNSPSYPSFKNNPTALLAAVDDFSLNEDFLISVGPHKAEVISKIVKEHKPRVAVELGGYLGYSAILFAQAMKEANGDTGLRFYSLELMPEFAAIASELIALAGLSDIVKVIVGSADASLKKLVDDGELKDIDLLFLDHDPPEELYTKDFKVVEGLGLLKKNGALVVADNVIRPGAPEYREFMRGKEGWESKGVKGLIWPGEIEDELEVSTFVGRSVTSA